ncbi:hypothetical protein N7499_003523 [Penicillium canescens]|uniref:Uncharacterized protein n=1 Tax=Penicillium canescens TaxID=5083 RepID=A0AAD6I8Z0_PENCN|nr:uncharacterized protein N7446_012449 [Penicillium canescens]KAJ6020233.1 hypothetical protein N7522_000308 [Penicillium canescens]KAJ6038187.1 hypothetical protein N7460_007958 [Penicillium canescens]KAJ6045585.1 hypothetical protein N7446_012449 [Penicillium canescens]KAJ6061271.1 hypothetical protein N7444_001967 [Penicillium canescens]KAJ6090809.1 hypothetical protein N7499_003523 [Penicillium canescens]
MSLEATDKRVSSGASSSIYSRSPDSPKGFFRKDLVHLPAGHDLPEINSLDHQIALVRGSTMALETTRTRLQESKARRRLSLPELRQEKLRQWGQHESENQFYRPCLNIFHDLSTAVTDISEDLTLQYHFEPEVSPVGNARVLQASKALREALENSRVQEARAERVWKCQWNVPRIWNPTTRWI